MHGPEFDLRYLQKRKKEKKIVRNTVHHIDDTTAPLALADSTWGSEN